MQSWEVGVVWVSASSDIQLGAQTGTSCTELRTRLLQSGAHRLCSRMLLPTLRVQSYSSYLIVQHVLGIPNIWRSPPYS